MPTSTLFETLYKKLNKAQKQAVDAIEGSVMVVAGPGTGKTQILSLRIANILLKTDTAPSSILAIAFTESAVKAMRKRLLRIIGSRAYEIPIYTFHGFANDRIQEFPDFFPKVIGGEPLSDIERVAIIEEILLGGTWQKLRPSGDPLFYVKSVSSVIQSIKREGYTPSVFSAYVAKQQEEYDKTPDKIHEKGAYKGEIKADFRDLQEKIDKNKELAEVFSLYESKLREKRFYDFEDMIIELVAALKSHQHFLRILQERYQYILVDEYQDTNSAQNSIVDLLASFHQNPNVFAVGDDKQAIYRFQGASVLNFVSFQEKYPGTLLIKLEENYRSTKPILDSSHALILNNASNQKEFIAPLRSQLESIDKITIAEAPDETSEYAHMFDDIEKRVAEGGIPEEIAIIYRDNSDADPLIRMLDVRGIVYNIASDSNIFDDRDVSKLLDFFKTLAHIDEPAHLGKVILFDFIQAKFGIAFEDAAGMLREAHNSRKPLLSVVKERHRPLFDMLTCFAKKASNEALPDVIDDSIAESGFKEHLISGPKNHAVADKIKVLIEECERYVRKNRHATMADFIDHIERIRTHNLSLRSGSESHVGVQLMTAHKSKGLEFDVVHIVGATNGHWSNKKMQSHFYLPGIIKDPGAGKLEDDRRLFFVAVTRARKSLMVSYPTRALDGKELLPAPFVEELGEMHSVRVKIPQSELFASSKIVLSQTERFKRYQEYIRSFFREQGLSVTALNNYLQCPWKYFFQNLLALPAIKSKPQLYGTAIHEALRYAGKDFIHSKKTTKEDVLSYFSRALEKLPLGERDFAELKAKGQKALSTYINHVSWQPSMEIEYRITLPYHETELKGNIDKIELFENGNAVVTDYKTGSPKSRNDIMGNTKTSHGDYYRQLVFYKMLFEGSPLKTRHAFKEGVIDFVEPDAKDNVRSERFTITDEEVVALKELLNKVIGEIENLSFAGRKCEEDDCEFCKLSESLTLRVSPQV